MTFVSRLQAFATEAMHELSVPGASVGISTVDGREILPLGITALDTQFAVRNDTLFQIGSISKPFAATLALALVEAGTLDLDAPVTSYVPELRLGSESAAQKITLRHLLSHQGGFWGDWFDDFGLADDAVERFVAEYWRLPQLFEPGSLWAYNNCGYILAGLVAARVAGKTYEDALKETVLDPLNMDHTFLSAAEAIAYPVAVGHTNSPDDGSARIARQFLRPRARNAAGGILASVEDVLTFAELHLGRRTGVISEATIHAMRTPQVATHEIGTSWGLGFKIQEADGGVIVGHGGATNGFRAQLEMVPEAGFAVAVLTNSDSGSRLTTEIVNWVLEDCLGITVPEQPTQPLTTERAAGFAGIYRQPYATIEIANDEADLNARVTTHSPYSENAEPQTGNWFGLRPIGDGQFEVVGGDMKGMQLKFWEDEDGTIRYLQAGGRLYVPGLWEELEGATAE